MPASVVGKIREGIVPLTFAAVILAIIVYEIAGASPSATPGYIVSRLLALILVCLLFSPFPALPVLYGWYSGNRAGAVLAGILPLPLFFITGYFLLRQDNMVFLAHDTISFVGILSAILGVAGYCAAQRTKEYLAVSVVLSGLWLVFFMSGID
jgi:hypothetical protein